MSGRVEAWHGIVIVAHGAEATVFALRSCRYTRRGRPQPSSLGVVPTVGMAAAARARVQRRFYHSTRLRGGAEARDANCFESSSSLVMAVYERVRPHPGQRRRGQRMVYDDMHQELIESPSGAARQPRKRWVEMNLNRERTDVSGTSFGSNSRRTLRGIFGNGEPLGVVTAKAAIYRDAVEYQLLEIFINEDGLFRVLPVFRPPSSLSRTASSVQTKQDECRRQQ
ncbi:hypothetical protein F5146DRAFT_320718 [Armillaria mellea]|nr:hypothetical protein F5146DRAFT_320718 [Armillaria mellea]